MDGVVRHLQNSSHGSPLRAPHDSGHPAGGDVFEARLVAVEGEVVRLTHTVAHTATSNAGGSPGKAVAQAEARLTKDMSALEAELKHPPLCLPERGRMRASEEM